MPAETKQSSLLPRWSYLSLRRLPEPSDERQQPPPPPPSHTSIRHTLMQQLAAYAGDHGAAVGVDVLHLSAPSASGAPQIIVRVAAADEAVVKAALATRSWGSGGAAGYAVQSSSHWLAALVADDSKENLFDFEAGEADNKS